MRQQLVDYLSKEYEIDPEQAEAVVSRAEEAGMPIGFMRRVDLEVVAEEIYSDQSYWEAL